MTHKDGHYIDDPLDVVNAKPDFSDMGIPPLNAICKDLSIPPHMIICDTSNPNHDTYMQSITDALTFDEDKF